MGHNLDQELSSCQCKVQLIGSWPSDLLLSAQSVVENEVYGANISLLYVSSWCPLGRQVVGSCSHKHNHIRDVSAWHCSNLMTDEVISCTCRFGSRPDQQQGKNCFHHFSNAYLLLVGCYSLKRHWFQINYSSLFLVLCVSAWLS